MDQPNLLVVHTDQQSWWAVGAYEGAQIETPHLDRIAREGAIFTNFFTNSAVCTPSRGCFLTGRYPHCHGAYVNCLPLNRDEVTFAEVFRRAGYQTGYAGKWHLDGTPRPGWVHPDRAMGFEDARFMFNRGHWKKIEDLPMGDTQPVVFGYRTIGDERTYTTDWLTDKTIQFLRRPRSQPFCYMVSFPDPHGPVQVRPPYDAMYRPEDVSIPETFDESSLPDWAKEAQARSPFAPGKPDRLERLRRTKALYLGEVRLIDDCVGRIRACLAEQGLLNRTILVFTTDHGDYMGEHGLHAKNNLYEAVYRIPLLVRWPEGIRAGTVVRNVVSTVDFQPTVLALAGVAPCGREQGRDASALLRDPRAPWAEEAFLHHSSLRRAGIFTDRHELAYVQGGQPILFDRVSDPLQKRNLFGDPALAPVVRDLTRRIVEHHRALASPCLGWLEALA